MKIIKIILMLIITVLALAGCSYVEFEKNVEDIIFDKNSSSQIIAGKYIESESETETDKSESDNENSQTSSSTKSSSELSIGQSFDASIDIERTDGSQDTIGQKGLIYTINSVEFYDNIYESGVEFNTWNLEWNPESCEYYVWEGAEKCYRDNMFVLFDVTVTYNARENGEKETEIRFSSDLLMVRNNEKIPNDWLEEFVELRKAGVSVIDPSEPEYFSGAPLIDEYSGFVDRDDILPIIHDGETLNFQIGYLTWEKFVEYKALRLQINSYNASFLEGYNGRYIDLFPEE
ncbi:MAG: hypothetical protein E7564_07790 [Ruminococcaceae bacterium]|nr:hypothetical protein [Oscillospiraceae bacterium]